MSHLYQASHGHSGGGHVLAHRHDPSSPHPAQAMPWSILRMPVVTRIAAALTVSAGLWAIVLVAMR